MKVVIFLLILSVGLSTNVLLAQNNNLSRINQFVDVTGTIGNSQGTIAGSYVHNWKIFKKQKWEIGLGARFTTYFGTKVDFITAGPAKKTRSFTTPFIIFFAGQNEQNFDTLTVQRPLTNSLNLTANIGYNFSRKLYAGFNIDVIGFTFGRKTSGVFVSSVDGPGDKIESHAKPTSFNALLTGDHDKGTLNSEFFLTYKLNNRWGVKAVYQFIFVEYETSTLKQTFAGGDTNNRFRNKANNFGLGISYNF